MDDNEILYISPLGLVIDDEELELRRKQIEEVAKMLLLSEEYVDDGELTQEETAMQNGFTKNDWNLFRIKLPEWQEAYMDKLNKEYVTLLNSDENASDKFWELEKRIKKDKRRAGVSVQVVHSEFIFTILELLRDDVIAMSDLDEFSNEFKETINYIYNR